MTNSTLCSPSQHVEFFIDRGVLGVNKEASHTVLEYRGEQIPPHTRHKFDSSNSLVVPVMPPTLVGVCRLLQMYYVLKVRTPTNPLSLVAVFSEKKGH